MKAIILLGAPGAGKGTVAEDLKSTTSYAHISTGNMLREAVKAGTPVGREAKAFMEKGELVPDDLILRIVRDRIQADGSGGRYMFDGFPRTERQAELLDELMTSCGGRVAHVFLLEVPRDVIIERISGRRICRQCGAVYNLRGMQPKREGICDQCGGELYQRPDDNEETIANRLEVYQRETASLIDYYERRGALVRVDARDRVETEKQIVRIMGQAS